MAGSPVTAASMAPATVPRIGDVLAQVSAQVDARHYQVWALLDDAEQGQADTV